MNLNLSINIMIAKCVPLLDSVLSSEGLLFTQMGLAVTAGGASINLAVMCSKVSSLKSGLK
jgi:hypothetical protein